MTAIVAVDFDWSIESCDKAPRDLDYERNTEKYGRAMKLTIDVRNWFLLNILRMDGQNFTKFCIHIIIDKIYVATLRRHFLQICNGVTALD